MCQTITFATTTCVTIISVICKIHNFFSGDTRRARRRRNVCRQPGKRGAGGLYRRFGGLGVQKSSIFVDFREKWGSKTHVSTIFVENWTLFTTPKSRRFTHDIDIFPKFWSRGISEKTFFDNFRKKCKLIFTYEIKKTAKKQGVKMCSFSSVSLLPDWKLGGSDFIKKSIFTYPDRFFTKIFRQK